MILSRKQVTIIDETTLTMELDEALKVEATKVFNEYGMDFEDGILVFLESVVKNQGLPFNQ